jgi:hypothetical protein
MNARARTAPLVFQMVDLGATMLANDDPGLL